MGYIVFGIVLLLGISVLVAFLLLIRALIKFIINLLILKVLEKRRILIRKV